MGTKENIQNRALLLIGAKEITDFTNASDNKIATLNYFYEEVKNKLLSLRNWTFATKREEIKSVEETESDYFKYSFDLPEDLIKVLSVQVSPKDSTYYDGYEVRGCKMLSDMQTLYVKYTFSPEDDCLPATFQDLLANALACEVCFKLTGDKTNQDRLYQKVWGLPSDNLKGGLFGFYSKIDASQNPTRRIQSAPLVYARWGGK